MNVEPFLGTRFHHTHAIRRQYECANPKNKPIATTS
ncbi:unnamed protein product [Haemonchus placei]|uniref:DNA-directed RNA polymerase n=1 Tax=Haemonchus placei TaxID=6290 RepID=A0A0N4X3U7_HAEPC|nr:unnamed protein product [Haemonchus placei]